MDKEKDVGIEMKEVRKNKIVVQWMVALVANLIMFNYGTQIGWMSPMAKLLQSDQAPSGKPLTDADISAIASAMCLTAAVSTPFYAWVTDRFGRKIAMICIAVMQAITWIIKISSTHKIALIIARIFCGLASGGCFQVIPMYTKEISQINIRGVLGTLTILFQCVGLFLMYAIGSYLGYYTVLWMVIGLPVVNLLLLLKVPESPSFLMKNGNTKEATAALAFLRCTPEDDKLIAEEINQLQQENPSDERNLPYYQIFQNRIYRKAFFIIFTIIMLQAANGNFAIITYAASIMESSGVTFSPELQTLSFPAVMILGAFTTMASVERLGRRFLLIGGFLITAIVLSILATSLLLQSRGYVTPSWIPVVTMMISVYCYSGSITSVPYIVLAEILNFKIRAKLIGIIVTSAWLVAYIQLLVFPMITNTLGMHSTLYISAIDNLLGCVVTLVYLPETKGKTIEQIEEELR